MTGIGDTDPPDVVREKLVRTIDFSAEWVEPHMRVWRALFGVQEPDDEPLEGEAFKDAIMELVPASTRHAGTAPRLLVFEDLHWCDEASMDVLIETAKLVDELPRLFLFAFRPDRDAPSWRLKRWLETELPDRCRIELSPPSERDSGELVDALLPAAEGLRAQILERTEGNPLFVEEVATAVLQLGADSDGAISIPDYAAGVDHRSARLARRSTAAHAAARLGDRAFVPRTRAQGRLRGRRRSRDEPGHPAGRGADQRDRVHS